MVVDDDVAADIQPQARARSGRLGGEERIEDPRLDLFGNAGTVVLDLDHHPGFGGFRPYDQPPVGDFGHGVDGVVDQVGPYLVQFAPERLDPRQIAFVFPVHVDAFGLVFEQHQGVVEPHRHVDVLHGSLIEVGVRLERLDDRRHSAGSLFDLIDEGELSLGGVDEADDTLQPGTLHVVDEIGQPIRRDPGINQTGRQFPAPVNVVVGQPGLDLVFEIGAFECGERSGPGTLPACRSSRCSRNGAASPVPGPPPPGRCRSARSLPEAARRSD